MTDTSESARSFVRTLAAFAERLADCGIVVRRLHCDWSIFGSWIVEATSEEQEARRSDAIGRGDYDESGPEVVRVSWDARDHRLSMESTPSEVLSMTNKWVEIMNRSCDSHEAALGLAEEWLRGRFGCRETR